MPTGTIDGGNDQPYTAMADVDFAVYSLLKKF